VHNRSFTLFDRDNRPTADLLTALAALGIGATTLPDIDDALQFKFFQKAGQKPLERWELKPIDGLPDVATVRSLLSPLGFITQTEPRKRQYLYAVWPGALLPRVGVRLQDLIRVWEAGVRWDVTVVHAGKRALMPDKESPVISKQLGFTTSDAITYPTDVQTEFDQMGWLYRNMSNLPVGLQKTDWQFINCPPNGDKRPSTEDVTRHWLKDQPKPGSLLVSSGAPYGMAQGFAFDLFMSEDDGWTIDVFGHEAPTTLTSELFCRELAGSVNRLRKIRNV
jgi:hypothetical protein